MLIRSMQEDDIPALARIVADNYDRHCAESFWTEARCAFSDFPFKPRFLSAIVDGNVVGCANWSVSWASWGVFTISWVQVDKGSQRRGVGIALVEEVLSELRPQAVLAILTTTIPEYYKRWGFVELQRYPASTPYEDADTEVLMSLRVGK